MASSLTLRTALTVMLAGAMFFLVNTAGAQSGDPGRHGYTLQGTNLTYFGSNDAKACQAACNRPDCKGWSYVYRGAFPSNPDNGVCYLMAQVNNQVPEKCCTSEIKGGLSEPATGVNMRGVWSGGFRCGGTQYRNTLNVTNQTADAFSGISEDNAPFNGRVQADGQANLSRPSWGQEYTARVTRTATGLRFDGTDVKNSSCGFTFTK